MYRFFNFSIDNNSHVLVFIISNANTKIQSLPTNVKKGRYKQFSWILRLSAESMI